MAALSGPAFLDSQATCEPRDVIPFRPQPLPVQYFVGTMYFPIGAACTAITRVWTIGETYHCRLCEMCSADHRRGVCQIMVSGAIDGSSVPLFSTVGLSLVRDAGPALYDTKPE